MKKEVPPAPSALFRMEALEAQRPKSLGTIVLLPSAWSRWTALASLALAVLICLLIAFGTYTRRSTVSGQIYPLDGLIRVTSSQPGVVVETPVRDGDKVQRGDLLFVLTGDRMGPDALDYQRGMSLQIEGRRRSLEADLQRIALAERQESELLRRHITSLQREPEKTRQQAQQHLVRIRIAEDAANRYGDLFKRGFVSRDELSVRDAELAQLRGEHERLQREALALERDLVGARRELDALHARYAIQRGELERAMLLARQEYTELESRRRIVVSAAADGRVTLIMAQAGQSVDSTRPLAHIVPMDSALIARLYAPSRAAGFVRPGQKVLLRYDAYPYQKFGQQVGTVLAVSEAAVSTVELDALALRPEWANEPLFMVTVSLPEQTFGANRPLPLHVGMRLEADLLHETRRLYEWILEPLYAARARVG